MAVAVKGEDDEVGRAFLGVRAGLLRKEPELLDALSSDYEDEL